MTTPPNHGAANPAIALLLQSWRLVAAVAELGSLGITAHSNMKRLTTSPDSAEIGLLRSRLEAAGIDCEIRNEHLSAAMPGAPFYPELWILDDAQFTEASELLASWRRPSEPQ